MKNIIFSDEEYRQILEQLNQMMQQADELPYPNAKTLIFELLKYFDSLHREPLARLMDTIKRTHPQLKATLEADFTFLRLLELYDLAEMPNPSAEAGHLGFVPAGEVKMLTPQLQTKWLELGSAGDYQAGRIYAKNFEKVNFLIARIEEKFYAIQNVCKDSILPLDLGTLEGRYIVCPWHGCRYDLATGESLGDRQKKLETFPVKLEADGIIRIGLSY